jgi:hypothetical protein
MPPARSAHARARPGLVALAEAALAWEHLLAAWLHTIGAMQLDDDDESGARARTDARANTHAHTRAHARAHVRTHTHARTHARTQVRGHTTGTQLTVNRPCRGGEQLDAQR